jgi:hypothetical protein
MNISTNYDSQITSGIQKMNELLKNATIAQLNLDDKLMSSNVISQVTGLGKNFDGRA